MLKGKKLYEYIGKNEKTKAIIKITKAGTGAPAREPLMDKDTHHKVIKEKAKKEEELKKMQEDKEDFSNSVWAHPPDLKTKLYGVSDIKWK